MESAAGVYPLRPSDPVESVAAAVRHRTVPTESALFQDIARVMVFKLITDAEVINTPRQNAA